MSEQASTEPAEEPNSTPQPSAEDLLKEAIESYANAKIALLKATELCRERIASLKAS